MTLPACPNCSKPLPLADAAFCPFCGACVQAPKQSVLPDGARKLLSEAEKQTDPVKKHALLHKAQKAFPDCLEIAEALLFLGRLHERSARALDYSVIKCHLLHMYLTPEDFSAEQQQQMREELFHHPQLERCKELAPDAHAFTRRYLNRLAREFVDLFLKGSSHYSRTWFGFRIESRMSRVLAVPAAQMLENIHQDSHLTSEERSLLYEALYRAYLAETGNETHWILEELKLFDCPIPSDD